MSENTKIVKNSLTLYVRLLIISIVGIISSRLILQGLGTSEFGLYNVVGGIVFMMAFLNNIMVATTHRFIAYEMGSGNLNNVNSVFNISLVIHIFIAIIVLILAETVGVYYINNYLNVAIGKKADALFVFQISMLSTCLSIVTVPLTALIVAKENFFFTAFTEILRNVLALGVVIFLIYYAGNRLKLYSILISAISIIPPVCYFVYCKVYYPLLIQWNLQKNRAKYKEMGKFSFWIMFGAAASAGELQGSALLINFFFGTILNASFGIANQVNTIIKMFAQSLNQAVIPQITKSYSAGNIDRTMKLVIFSSKYCFLLILIPSLPILLETDFILNLWLTKVPEYTSIFIQLMILNVLILMSNAGIPAAIHATGKIKYFQIILSTIELMGLPISYLLFKCGFPPFTILLVYTFVASLSLFVRQILLKRLIQFNVKEFFNKAYLKMIMVSVALVPLFIINPFFESNMLRFISVSCFSISWLLLFIYFLGMEKDERIFVNQFIVNFVNKFFQKNHQQKHKPVA